jgi:hypothetical protein
MLILRRLLALRFPVLVLFDFVLERSPVLLWSSYLWILGLLPLLFHLLMEIILALADAPSLGQHLNGFHKGRGCRYPMSQMFVILA